MSESDYPTKGNQEASEAQSGSAGADTATGTPTEELGGAAPQGTNAPDSPVRGEPGTQAEAGSVMDDSTPVEE